MATLAPLQAQFPLYCQSLLHRLIDSIKELSAHQQLTIFLIFEMWKGTKSWWREYINSLPALASFRGMPVFWISYWHKRLPPAAYGL